MKKLSLHSARSWRSRPRINRGLTRHVREGKRAAIPSVTHVDASARPQTVEKEIKPLYWRLIDEFEKRTGVPVIMNTSFNLRGEAIVHTPTDAVRTFLATEWTRWSWGLSRSEMSGEEGSSRPA